MNEAIESYFLSPRKKTDPSDRPRLLLYFLLISIIFAIVYVADTFLTDFVIARYAMYISIALFTVELFGIRANWPFHLLANAYIAICLLIITLLSVHSGVLFSYVLPWLCLIPVMALLLISSRAAWPWLGITIATLSIFSLLQYLAWTPAGNFTPPYPISLNFSLIAGLILILFFITSQFNTHKKSLQQQIELHNEELRTTEAELRQNMEELLATQDALARREAESRILIDELLSGRKQLVAQREKLERFTVALMTLAKNKIIEGDNFSKALTEIFKTGLKELSVSRLSLWQYKEEAKSIICVGLLTDTEPLLQSGPELRQADFPNYFDAILKEEIIIAHSAREHPATHHFLATYLHPLNIYSILDIPILYHNQFYGVLCCEQQSKERVWTEEEIIFVKSLADIITLSISTCEGYDDKKKIELQNDQIKNQNQELVNISNELRLLNSTLEERVHQRTKELEEQNNMLAEYAFINAHLLRGPLCSVMGLVNLLEITPRHENPESIIKMMRQATDDLDAVIQRVTSLLGDQKKFARDQIRLHN